jgi:hypothetical protein
LASVSKGCRTGISGAVQSGGELALVYFGEVDSNGGDMKHLGRVGFVTLSIVGLGSMCCFAAEPAPVTRAPQPSIAISVFAASHQRVKGRLPEADRIILDRMSAQVRRALPRNARLPEDARRILATAMPGLAVDEIEALANYATGDAGQSSMMQATQQMQEAQMSFNLQYLALQNQMQNEERQFTMISNIMKARHDTVNNSINNIR